jgi:DNA-binding MarR family transcriptional regulator
MKVMSTKNLTNGDLSSVTTYQAGVLQASAHRMLQKQCDALLAPYDITKTQWLIIGTVLDTGATGIRITDLAEQLDTTLSYLTNTINLLESKGILLRTAHEGDTRAKLVRVSESFVPKCTEIEQTLREGLRKTLYVHIAPADFKVYMKVLLQLSELR